ncbi:MAG: LLM class flavin-dependent oxidoreductase [Tepidiformaceae bacterium]
MRSIARQTPRRAGRWRETGGELAADHPPAPDAGDERAHQLRRKSWRDFELFSIANVIVTNDVKAALDSIKPQRALYLGGMGARTTNFHNDRMVKRGYPEEAARIQELFLAGRGDEAAAAIPDEFIDEEALVGPPDPIREKFKAWADAGENGLTGLSVWAWQPEARELLAELAETRASIRK